MLFKTHGIPVCPCCCDQEEQWLCSGITGAFGHDIEQFPVRLCMQLVKDDRMDIQTVLGVCSATAPDRSCWSVYIQAFYGHDRLDPFLQCRTLVYHIHRNIKYDGSLLPVGSTAVNLCSPFTVTACHIQCNGSRQLRFSVFLRYLTITGIVMPVSVFLYRPIKGTDDLSCQGRSSNGTPLHLPLVCFRQFIKLTAWSAFASSNIILHRLSQAEAPFHHSAYLPRCPWRYGFLQMGSVRTAHRTYS